MHCLIYMCVFIIKIATTVSPTRLCQETIAYPDQKKAYNIYCTICVLCIYMKYKVSEIVTL